MEEERKDGGGKEGWGKEWGEKEGGTNLSIPGI
jgi:hypothetical protein